MVSGDDSRGERALSIFLQQQRRFAWLLLAVRFSQELCWKETSCITPFCAFPYVSTLNKRLLDFVSC